MEKGVGSYFDFFDFSGKEWAVNQTSFWDEFVLLAYEYDLKP
jgi:hypothetical protein